MREHGPSSDDGRKTSGLAGSTAERTRLSRRPWTAWRSRREPAVTPDVRQSEHAECGLAALAIALGGLGLHVHLETLRGLAGSTVGGTTIRELRDLARHLGCEAGVHRADPEQFVALGLPLLCHMRFIHFVVVERVEPGWVRLNDPSAGPVRVPRGDFERDFTGIVLRLRRPDPSVSPRRADDRMPFRLLPALWRRLAPERPALASALIAAGLAGALAVAATMSGASVLDQVLGHQVLGDQVLCDQVLGGGAPSHESARPLVLAALAGLAGLVASRVGTGAVERLRLRSRAVLTAMLADMPAPALMLRDGRRFSTILRAPDRVFEPRLVRAAQAGAALLGMGAALVVAAPVGAACLLPLLLLDAILILALASWRGHPAARMGEGAMPAIAFEAAALRQAGEAKLGFDDDADFQRLAGLHALGAAEAVRAACNFAGPGAALSAIGPLRVAVAIGLVGCAGRLGPDEPRALGIVAAVALAGLLRPALLGLLPVAPLRSALLALDDVERAGAVLVAEPGPDAAGAPSGPLSLEIEAVSWQPAPSRPPVLADISARVAAGGALGITGPTGSGLTTLCRMAAGLLPPSRGSIRAGGAPVSSASRRREVVLAGQDGAILPGSLADNLRLGRRDSDDVLCEVLEAVGLAGPLAPRGGLALRLSEGGPELSGGERSRLTIARALLRRPGLLVVDGLLDAVEVPRAAAIVAAIRSRGVTLVVATKRAETLAFMDDVLTLGAAQP